MSGNERTHQDKETAIHRIARGIAGALAEDNEVQRFLVAWRMNPHNYVLRPARAYAPGQGRAYVVTPGRAPDTYAEFLLRTSGALIHEPSARERARGHWPFG
jgi:hypothetical protein